MIPSEANEAKHLKETSLANRLGVSVEKLDYEYLDKCKDGKEVEKILKVLRSNEEGCFPDLERKAEERLLDLIPSSRLLRKSERLQKLTDLDKEEFASVSNDLSNWLNDVNAKDLLLKSKNGAAEGQSLAKNLPPVRATSATTVKPPAASAATQLNGEKSAKRQPKPRDYKEWDKIINQIDDKDEPSRTSPRAKPMPDVPKHATHSKPAGLKDSIDTKDMTDFEKEKLSQHEKEKGNEAVKAASFAEAVTYYSRSVSVRPSIAVYNNRALAYIKMEKWSEAIADCELVLGAEPHDIKALMRRATAYKGQRKFSAAKEDLDAVLAMEPQNKKAEELLTETLTQLEKDESRKSACIARRMVIEETDGEDSETENESSNIDQSQQSSGSLVKEAANADDVADVTMAKLAAAPGVPSEKSAQESAGKAVAPLLAAVQHPPKRAASRSLDSGMSAAVLLSDRSVPIVPAPQPAASVQVNTVKVPQLPVAVATLTAKGSEQFKAGQYGEALATYDRAIAALTAGSNTNYAYHLSTLYSNRAACRSKTGDIRGCVSDCTASLELVPLATKPLQRRALAYESLEKYALAYADYRQTLCVLADDAAATAMQQGAARCQNVLQNLHGSKWREQIPKVASSSNLVQYEFEGAPGTSENTGHVTAPRLGAEPSKADLTTLASQVKKAAAAVSTSSESVAKEQYEKLKNEGNNSVKQGDFLKAITAYTKCIQLSSVQAVGYTNRALCYLRTNEPQLAVDDAKTALSLERDNLKALYRLAQAEKMLCLYQSSRESFLKLLQLDPGNKEAHKELEQVNSICSQIKEAAAAQVRKGGKTDIPENKAGKSRRIIVVETDSDEESSKLEASDNATDTSATNMHGSNVQEAAASKKARSTARDGSSSSQQAENAGSGLSPPLSASGATTSAPKIVAEETSFSDLRAPATVKKSTKRVSPMSKDVSTMKNRAEGLFQAGQYGEAVATYDAAILALQQNDCTGHAFHLSTLYCERAACRDKTGDMRGCVSDCTASLELVPLAVKPLQHRALAYENLEKYALAYADYQQALAITSGSGLSMAQQGAARCQKVLQQLHGSSWRDRVPKTPSVTDFVEYEVESSATDSAANSNFPNSIHGAPHALPGTGLHVGPAPKSKKELAEADYEQLKEEGNQLVRQGDHERAAIAYGRCAELFPERSAPYTNRALCRLRLGQARAAADDCNTTLRLEPGNVKALFRLGQAEKMAGNYKESLSALAKLLQADKGNKDAQKEMDFVKDLYREQLKKIKFTNSNTIVINDKCSQSHPSASSKTDHVRVKSSANAAPRVPEARSSTNSAQRPGSATLDGGAQAQRSAASLDHLLLGKGKAATNRTSTEARDKRSQPPPAASEHQQSQHLANGRGSGHDMKTTEDVRPSAKLSRATPYAFMSTWTSLRNSKTNQPYADLLRQLEPEEIAKVIANQIDGDMLSKIVTTLKEHFTSADDVKVAHRFLTNIRLTPRFEMVRSFLSTKDRQAVKDLLTACARHGVDSTSVHQLKKDYSV